MNSTMRRLLSPLTGALAIGCSAGENSGSLLVGSQGTGGAGTSGGLGAAGQASLHVGDAGAPSALSAHIEERGVTVEIVALKCAGDCADVVAVAKGGNEPYTFAWEDGGTDPFRHVCPTEKTAYRVSVTDTGVTSGEFRRAPNTVDAPLTAEVLACPAEQADAGTAIGPGTPWTGCVQNPSFEGAVTPTQFQAFDAPPWNACYAGGFLTYSAIGNETLWPTQNWTFPKAADGITYLALGQQGPIGGRASETLCEPIHARSSRSFLVDLARAPSTSPSLEATGQFMQVVGGGSECNETAVLWTSPQLALAWTTYCVTVTPTEDVTSLGFRPLATGGAQMEGLVDQLLPVTSCP
jgi:hypothetical protein